MTPFGSLSRMADQLRPYMYGSSVGAPDDETTDGGSGDDVPLLTVSDINPDMLEVI